jgi:hypothetical protein
VIVLSPGLNDRVKRVAIPELFTDAVPRMVVPAVVISLKVTRPVGVTGPIETGDTVAVKFAPEGSFGVADTFICAFANASNTTPFR